MLNRHPTGSNHRRQRAISVSIFRGNNPVTAHHARNNKPRGGHHVRPGVTFHMKTLIQILTALAIAITITLGGSLLLAPKPTSQTDTTEKQTQGPVTKPIGNPPAKTRIAQQRTDPLDNDDFYQTIVDNNLFRPLGWRPPKKRNSDYQLLGTMTNSGMPAKAILQHHTSKRTYTVSVGDILGDFQVTEIQPRRVTLKKENQHISLPLDNTLLINPRSR